jgi:hypothetical protein
MKVLILGAAIVAAGSQCNSTVGPFDKFGLAADSIIVTSGTAPAFFWHGHNARLIEVTQDGLSNAVWRVIATDSLAGIRSPLLYGICPSASAAAPVPTPALARGRSYAVTMLSIAGTRSTTRFSP